MDQQYKNGKTDEFMPPLIFSHANEQRVRDGDVVLFFNFRADRARQLSQAFLLKNFDGFDREVWPQVEFVTLTQYDVTYSSPFIFAPEKLADILGEIVSAAGKRNCASPRRKNTRMSLIFLMEASRSRFRAKTAN